MEFTSTLRKAPSLNKISNKKKPPKKIKTTCKNSKIDRQPKSPDNKKNSTPHNSKKKSKNSKIL